MGALGVADVSVKKTWHRLNSASFSLRLTFVYVVICAGSVEVLVLDIVVRVRHFLLQQFLHGMPLPLCVFKR